MRNYWREWINSNNRNVFLVLAVTFTDNENTTGNLFCIVNKIGRYRSQQEVTSLMTSYCSGFVYLFIVVLIAFRWQLLSTVCSLTASTIWFTMLPILIMSWYLRKTFGQDLRWLHIVLVVFVWLFFKIMVSPDSPTYSVN
jgi:hypothetical protein